MSLMELFKCAPAPVNLLYISAVLLILNNQGMSNNHFAMHLYSQVGWELDSTLCSKVSFGVHRYSSLCTTSITQHKWFSINYNMHAVHTFGCSGSGLC